jgi:hypothetical protein
MKEENPTQLRRLAKTNEMLQNLYNGCKYLSTILQYKRDCEVYPQYEVTSHTIYRRPLLVHRQ